MEQRISDLLREMTLSEKIGQLNQIGESVYGKVDDTGLEKMIEDGRVGSLLFAKDVATFNRFQRIACEKSRLKIPLIFAFDIIHGIRTIFPTPLAESCSWDFDLARRSAEVAASEGSALGYNWTYAPMVDIVRDNRWGRVIESSGEDPYLSSGFANARVKGFQGENYSQNKKIDKNHLGACAKHFVAYGACESGRDYNTVQLSQYNLLNIYLPSFKSCVDSGVMSFMTAFNDLNGTPCTVNQYLLKEILRDKWQFDGVVVSDYGAIDETVKHGYCENREDACTQGVKCSVDIDMCSDVYIEQVENAIASGKITIEEIDKMVYNVLLLKERLGLFDNPYTDESLCKTNIRTKYNLETALESAQKSITLLKNNGILPLKQGKNILLTGWLADERRELHGNWAADGSAEFTDTIKEGLERKYNVTYIKGFDDKEVFTDFDNEEISKEKYDAIVVVAGERFINSGEATSKTFTGLEESQVKSIQKLIKKEIPVILLMVNGRPIILDDNIINNIDGIVECWQLGTKMADAVSDVLCGNFNPQGKLTMSMPRREGQCPIYYNHFSTGRPCNKDDHFTSKYIDCENTPLYCFGYGLSYSNFVYGKIKCDKEVAFSDEKINISVEVKNDSETVGTETVQLYVQDVFSKPVRPVKELIGFRKVKLGKGESKVVSFEINVNNLGIIRDESMKKQVEPGDFRFYVGSNSSCTDYVTVKVIDKEND